MQLFDVFIGFLGGAPLWIMAGAAITLNNQKKVSDLQAKVEELIEEVRGRLEN